MNHSEKFWEKTEYRPVPAREKDCEQMISFAREFAQRYGIRLEISHGRLGVTLRLYCHETIYTRYMKKDLAKLILKCDDMSITSGCAQGCDYVLVLNYYTQEAYINGRKIGLTENE